MAPVNYQVHLQLSDLKIRNHISFKNISLQSDRFIVCKDDIGTDHQMLFIDIRDSTVNRYKTDSDLAIIHARKRIAGFKLGRHIRIMDIDKKDVINMHLLSEDIEFWRFIDEHTIGIVTASAVYHWVLTASSYPLKMFNRDRAIAGFKIQDYRVDSEGRWLALVGTQTKGAKVVGKIQLFSRNTLRDPISAPIEAQVACFVMFRMEGNAKASSLIAYANKNEQGCKVHIRQLGHVPTGDVPFSKKSVDVTYFFTNPDDLPASMQACRNHGLVYLITKHGTVHIFDVESGARIHSTDRPSPKDIIRVTTEHPRGIMAINRKGQVISLTVNPKFMVDQVMKHSPEIAFKLAKRWNVAVVIPSAPTLPEEEVLGREAFVPPPPQPTTQSLAHQTSRAQAPPAPRETPVLRAPSSPTAPRTHPVPTDPSSSVPVSNLYPSHLLYEPPPAYSEVEPRPQNEAQLRAERAERERDELAARLAEMERRLQAMEMNAQPQPRPEAPDRRERLERERDALLRDWQKWRGNIENNSASQHAASNVNAENRTDATRF